MKTRLYDFAMKWYKKFSLPRPDGEILYGDASFERDCRRFGFTGNRRAEFERRYPGAFENWDTLEYGVGRLADLDTPEIKILGSVIFAKWKSFHEFRNDRLGCGKKTRLWFCVALLNLARLSRPKKLPGAGNIRKLRLVSHSLAPGDVPGRAQEVEQRLTIRADGRVSLSMWKFRDGDTVKSREAKFEVPSELAVALLRRVDFCFDGGFPTDWSRIGAIWDLKLSYRGGKTFRFCGQMSASVRILNEISNDFRKYLCLPECNAFDGWGRKDRIERLSIDYRRPAEVSGEGESGYRETLLLDRVARQIVLTRDVGSGQQIRSVYQLGEGVGHLLDQIQKKVDFFTVTPEARKAEPADGKSCAMTVEFLHRGTFFRAGGFHRDALPEGFSEMAADIHDFMNRYGEGEIFCPAEYTETFGREKYLVFCNVSFHSGEKTYCYLTDDETLRVGDRVIVPVGPENRELTGRVESVEYRRPGEAPYPLGRIKRILRKVEEEPRPPGKDTN